MKLVTYEFAGESRVGAVRDQSVIDLAHFAPDMLGFIDAGNLFGRGQRLMWLKLL